MTLTLPVSPRGPRRTRRPFACAHIGLLAFLLATATAPAAAQSTGERHIPKAGYAWREQADTWRFRYPRRRVKAVVLAGSIGAFMAMPYARLLHQWCSNVEVQNLSKVGLGAPQLYQRFRKVVIPRASLGAPRVEHWLIFGGGINSVSSPHRTNDAIRRLFEAAHRRGMRVVALTLTPWGDRERWSRARGARLARGTRNVVDNVLGHLSPAEALGSFIDKRKDPEAPWQPAERPDIVVDLYNSALRDVQAAPLALDEVRSTLAQSPAWTARVRELSPREQAERLDADASLLAASPQRFLAPHYRGFDPIHPNRAGHELIARLTCRELPQNWGCACPE